MKHIGLISDTHGYIGSDAMKHLEKCDEIWHAGDIGSLEIVDTLENLKTTRMIYGNIDGTEIRQSCMEYQFFVCEGLKILMIHIGGYPGRYTRRAFHLIMVQ